MAERQTRSPRTRRGSWNGGKKEEEGKSPLVPEGNRVPGCPRGGDLCGSWLNRSHSIAPLAFCAPEILSGALFSFYLLPPPCCSPSRFSPPLLRPFSIRIYTNRGSNATVSDCTVILPRFDERQILSYGFSCVNNNNNKNQSRQIFQWSERKNESMKHIAEREREREIIRNGKWRKDGRKTVSRRYWIGILISTKCYFPTLIL